MDLILTDKSGKQIKMIQYPVFDCDCNGSSMDFSLSVPISDWDGSIDYGCRLIVPDEEYGGIVGQISSDTGLGTITVSGYTWRGMLAQKVISPPSGEDYMIVSGDANDIMRTLIGDRFSNVITVALGNSGITVETYQFKRYCTLLDGLTKMLSSVNARLELQYDTVNDCLVVSAVPAYDYSYDIELSQDYDLQFTYDDIRNKPNHLIVGGKGELQNREILHLYLDGDGNVTTTQYYFGIDEIEAFWENTSTDELEKDSRKHFEEIKNSAKLDMNVNSIPNTARIGDIVGGRDRITGLTMKSPISNIILQINGDLVTKNYKLEGET